MKLFIIVVLGIMYHSLYAQSVTTFAYDANGNRISKKMQGSSSQPSVVASPQAVNPGQPANLMASGCSGTIQWSTGQQGANITVSPTIATPYSASCVIPGCTAGVGKVTVDVIQCVLDEMTVSASSTTARYGQPVTMMAYGCTGTVEWSTGQKGNTAIINIYGPVTQILATCTKPYCSNAGSSGVLVGGTTGCGTGDVLVTMKEGNWSDPAVWSCKRIPTINDEVYINHPINISGVVYAKLLVKGEGVLLYDANASIVIPSY